MEFANQELAQKLFELSGWIDNSGLSVEWYVQHKQYPSYSLGYLWRKFEDLGNDINVGFHDSSCNMTFAYGQRGTASLLEGFGQRVEVDPNDTVEDYFCEFFIRLFKQGDLKK